MRKMAHVRDVVLFSFRLCSRAQMSAVHGSRIDHKSTPGKNFATRSLELRNRRVSHTLTMDDCSCCLIASHINDPQSNEMVNFTPPHVVQGSRASSQSQCYVRRTHINSGPCSPRERRDQSNITNRDQHDQRDLVAIVTNFLAPKKCAPKSFFARSAFTVSHCQPC